MGGGEAVGNFKNNDILYNTNNYIFLSISIATSTVNIKFPAAPLKGILDHPLPE